MNEIFLLRNFQYSFMKRVRLLFTMLAVGAFGLSYGQTVSADSVNKKVDQLSKEVEGIKNLKVSGWVQAQFQWAESKGSSTFDGGDFLPNSNTRFMIRRGRVKFTYTQKYTQYVLQMNATERGVNLTDFYAMATDPWTKQFSLTAGVMNRPFGFEIQQSSSVRETPERSRFTQTLLPNERDLGAMITFQPTKGKKLFGLKWDAGFYNGTGIAVPGTTSLNGAGVVDFDNYKDFISRLYYTKTTKNEKVNFGIGTSYYKGGFVYTNNVVYDHFERDNSGNLNWTIADTVGHQYKGHKAPRTYYDVEFQFSVQSKLGKTSIRSEYIFGQQSGTASSSKSPSSLSTASSEFERNFDGFYTYFIHRIGKTKHEFAFKYEWYDPDTKVAAADFKTGTNLKSGDIKFNMLGLGYNYYFDQNVKFMIYYNIVKNETVEGLSAFSKDLKDNVFTIRMQYRF